MADVQHSSFQHADAHEPRHITLNGVGASGSVITNSSSVTQTSEYRRLVLGDIDEIDEVLMVFEIDSSTTTGAQTHYIPAPFGGLIQNWVAVVDNPLVTATNTYELRIDGVQVTSTPITFPTAGSPGDQQSATATGANSFSIGQNIEIVGTAINNTDATVDTRFAIIVRRN